MCLGVTFSDAWRLHVFISIVYVYIRRELMALSAYIPREK